jgi:hypothetical protein
VVGGAVLLAAGAATAAAIKLSQPDVERIEQSTGVPVEELTEEELVAAMEQLGIQSIELDENDQAIITDQAAQAPAAPVAAAPAAAPAEPEPSYLDELERLANLRDQGIISDEEFDAKKKQLLGL